MGDLGMGVGGNIGSLGGRTLPVAGLLTLALVAALALPALAAEITTVKGDKIRMANTKLADRLTRYADPADDQTRLDGTPEADAPDWSDIRSVTVVPTRMRTKLIEQMRSDYPPGAARVYYGDGQIPTSRDRIVFVAVKMAKRLPADSLGQQVEIGLAGRDATPVQNGSQLDTWVGTETFTLAGRFSDGAYGVGTTDVSGREPGLELEVEEYYDVETGTLGFYAPGAATWYVVLPRSDGASAITVAVRSSTAVGSVIDRLDLPGGGHFIDLDDPTGGYKIKSEGPLLSCRALETFNGEAGTIETLDPDANLVRYTAAAGDPALLASAAKAAGPVSVAVTAVGTEDGPSKVEGTLTATPEGDAVTLEFEVPEGQWSFALDGDPPRTPHGERIIDHMTLTGPAGVAVGPGLDGYVAGGLECATSADEAAQGGGAADAAAEDEDPADDEAA